MRKINFYLMLLLSASIISCSTANLTGSQKKARAQNVILLIGDGMGLPALYSAMSTVDYKFNIERFPETGFQKTCSADNYITDSAAGGTAMATGNKTKNGVIGMDASNNRVKSILELAEENGLATGLVSTSSLTHATPASFIAHQSSRGSYEDIALDFLKTDVDVLIGGGLDHFAKRKDKLNLVDSLKARGYEVVTSSEQVKAAKSNKLAALTAPVHHPYRLKGRGNMLPEATEKAIEILSKNKKGFFLMIEGSQIDWAAHANRADTLIDETIDFDIAVGKALDFAEREGNTLVIVTADHETGGVTLVGGDLKERTVKLNFSKTDHTALPAAVFAYGPGAARFSGFAENTDLFYKMKEILRLK